MTASLDFSILMPSSSMIFPRALNFVLENWHLEGRTHRLPSFSLRNTMSKYTKHSSKVSAVISKSSTNNERWWLERRSGPNIVVKARANKIGDRECPNGNTVGCHWFGSPGMEKANFSLHSFAKGMH